MHATINPQIILDLLCVCIDDGVRVWVGPQRGFKIKGLKIEF